MAASCCGPRARSRLLLALVLLLAACSSGVRAALSEDRPAGRQLQVVGGWPAGDAERYPWMTRLHFLIDGRLGMMGGCGGSLVSRSVILTAAHCVSLVRKDFSNVFVRVGAYNALTDEALRPGRYHLRRVKEISIHPRYVERGEDQITSPNDLALMLLDAPLPDAFPVIHLAGPETPYPAHGTPLYVLGWGSTDQENTQPAYDLMEVKLPVVAKNACSRQWSYAGAARALLTDGQVCAGLDNDRNICFGDSGGPLLLPGNSSSMDLQLGVVSFSFPTCALPGMPGVFTWIPRYRDWLDPEIARLESHAAGSVAAASAVVGRQLPAGAARQGSGTVAVAVQPTTGEAAPRHKVARTPVL